MNVLPVLVVDDEGSIVELVQIVLRKRGYEVDTARNLREARKAISEKVYGILITDNDFPSDENMPVVQNAGVELVKDARMLHPHIFICLMTGRGRPQDVILQAFLPKPFLINQLEEMLKIAEDPNP